MKKRILCLAGACAFSTVTLADPHSVSIEGFLGRAHQENAVTGFQTLSGYGTSKGLRAGVAVNRILDLEVAYADFGKAEDSGPDAFGDLITDTLDSSAAQVGIKARLPLNRSISLIGRAGVALWELDYRQTDSAFPGEAYTDSDEGTDAYFGVGMQVQLEENLFVGLDYSSLNFTAALGDASTDHDISNFSMSLGFAF